MSDNQNYEEVRRNAINTFLQNSNPAEFSTYLLNNYVTVAQRARTLSVEAVLDDIVEVGWRLIETTSDRGSAYREVHARQNDQEFSFDDALLHINKYWQAARTAMELLSGDSWKQIIDRINERVSELTVQDTTLQTITIGKNDKEDVCCVCLIPYVDNETLQKCPECKNRIHEHCILRCLKEKPTCPLCRHVLIQNPEDFQKLEYPN